MTELLQFTLFGLMLGCIYAIAAMGLVLTYTVTGVFNFAHGAVGMIAAFVYYGFHVEQGVSTPLAVLIVVFLGAPIAGLVAERLLRPFQGSGTATSLVVTIALTVGLLGVAQKVFPEDVARNAPYLFGDHRITLLDVPISYDRIAQVAIAIVVAFGLRFLLFGTALGARMRSVVDDPELARLNGVRSVVMARCSWMIGFVLAALAGVLFSAGTNLNAIVLTLLVLSAYGAAMIGRLTSLPMTFVGALVLGLCQELPNVSWLWPGGDVFLRVRLAIPGLFLVLAVLLVPSFRLSAGRVVGRDQPPVPTLRRSVLAGVALVGIVALVANLGPADLSGHLVRGLVIATISLSLVAVTGLSGQISLTQYLFLGLGAFVAGEAFGGNNVLGMLLGGLLCGVLGVLVALPSVRLRGLHLALSTFGIALIGRSVLLDDPRIFGRSGRFVARPDVLGISTGSDTRFAVWSAIVFVVLAIVVGVVRRSWFGRQLTAIRDSETTAATLGIRVRWAKVGIFAFSAFIAGYAGALFGGMNGTADGTQFDPINSLVILLYAFVGGITTVTGAAIAGGLFAALVYAQSTYPDLAGLVFVVVAAAAIGLGRQPDGLAGVLTSAVGEGSRWRESLADRSPTARSGRTCPRRSGPRHDGPEGSDASAVRALRVGLGLLVAASFLEGAPSGAQAAGTLGGYQGTAAASGVHAFYNLGNILPTPPPVDLAVPDALATIASGPSTFARASVADPGDLLANPDVVLSLASSAYPAGTLPAYPYRISASSGTGSPSAEVSPVPGLSARVDVTDGGSKAHATLPAVDAPAVATFGSVVADTTTETDGSTVTVTARTRTSGFNVVGLLTIDSITTSLKATSDGGDTKVSGGTTIAGAELLGMPITIDATGIHPAGASDTVLGPLLSSITTTLAEALKQAGITVTLAGPVKLDGGTSGQLASAGLKVDFELSDRTFPALAALVDSIPPIENPLPGAPGLEDLLTIAKAKHLVSIEVARATVSLAARPAAEFSAIPESPTDDGGGSFAFPETPPSFESPEGVATGSPGPAAPKSTSTTKDFPDGAGIGSLVLLALLAVPFIGDRLGAAAYAILSANHTEPCAWEGP